MVESLTAAQLRLLQYHMTRLVTAVLSQDTFISQVSDELYIAAVPLFERLP